MTVPEIILASASPRRAALLNQIRLSFRTHPSALGDDGEAQLPGEKAEAYACRLALAKAREVAAALKHGLVIGADTVVTCEERLLGKPRDREEAQAFLLSLAGRTHQVITGVAVVEAATGRAEVDAAVTGVTMRPFDAKEAARRGERRLRFWRGAPGRWLFRIAGAGLEHVTPIVTVLHKSETPA